MDLRGIEAKMASDGTTAQRSQVVILPGALAHVVQKQGNAPAIPSIRGHADVPGGVENDDVALPVAEVSLVRRWACRDRNTPRTLVRLKSMFGSGLLMTPT